MHEWSEQLRFLRFPVDGVVLSAGIVAPTRPRGVVIVAEGTGNAVGDVVAETCALKAGGFVSLVVDPLAPAERGDARRLLDVFLIARRLRALIHGAEKRSDFGGLPVGLLGHGTAAAGALVASVDEPRVRAVVCAHGRADLADGVLHEVTAPTLVMKADGDDLGRAVVDRLRCPKSGAGVAPHVPVGWFDRHLDRHGLHAARAVIAVPDGVWPPSRARSIPAVAM